MDDPANEATVEIIVSGHWVNAWFMKLFGKPVVVLDGTRHEAEWDLPYRLLVSPGTHVVRAGVRYRGTSALLGTVPAQIDVTGGEVLTLRARNGFVNSTPFRIRSAEV